MGAKKAGGRTALASGVVTAGDREDVELPSGRMASVMNAPTGKQLNQAARLLGASVVPGSWNWYLGVATVITLIDGRPFALEDLDDMPSADVSALFGLAVGKAQAAPSVGIISPSSASTGDSQPPS